MTAIKNDGSAPNVANERLDAALAYAQRGWSVIPLRPRGKLPSLTWRPYQREIAVEATIRTWWDIDGERNVGIVTGAVSGLIVLDVDGPEGTESLKSCGGLPETPTVRTGKGRHYYFRHPGGQVRNFAGKLPGIDLRGDGGYVVAPPSIHPDDPEYTWELSPDDAPLADPPEWLVALMIEPALERATVIAVAPLAENQQAQTALASELAKVEAAVNGQRNHQLNRSGFALGQLIGAGELERQEVETALSETARAIGLEDREIDATIKSGLDAGIKEPQASASRNTAEILESAPLAVQRPLCLVGGRSYAATWVWVEATLHETVDGKSGKTKLHNPPIQRRERELVVVRDDGQAFTDVALGGSKSISELGLDVQLPEVPPGNRIWSGGGVKRYLRGERPNPAVVFTQVAEVVDRFIDFNRSLAEQHIMCELTACYVLATYLLDAFNVIGYLWPNGERGSGKTHYLATVSELAYLGQVILSGGSYATLRDLADYGACLAFDDCEDIGDARRSDPDKRALLLAGNRRGTTITVKEPAGENRWKTRYVNAFCPRLFSAIRLPDEVLASRTIIVPLVRSIDDKRANADPLDSVLWPTDRQGLIDDLWALGVANLPMLRQIEAKAVALARLSGRNLEPWRAILAVALWLQEAHGVDGLFERMEPLSVAYQEERTDFEVSDPTGFLVLALWDLLERGGQKVQELETSAITGTVNNLARDASLTSPDESFTNPKRVGKLLSRLRFTKATSGKSRRRWRITREDVEAVARSYAITLPEESNAENVENAETSNGASAFRHVRHVRRYDSEGNELGLEADFEVEDTEAAPTVARG